MYACNTASDSDLLDYESLTKVARVWGPLSEAGRDHIGDHSADIMLLRRVVIRPRMVAGGRQSPAPFAGLEIA